VPERVSCIENFRKNYWQGKQFGIGKSLGVADPPTAANVNVKTNIASTFFIENLLRSGLS
jgi:hypothetical protein